MRTQPYWIEGPWPGKLAILPRPRGGDWLEEDVRIWRRHGVAVAVSLLTNAEIDELDLGQEASSCSANGIQFLLFPIADRDVPSSRTAASEFLKSLDSRLAEGNNLAIHCRQGIGRSAVIAACLLVLSGVTPERAFERISTARGLSVPETSEQRDWVVQFARESAPVSTAGRDNK